MLYVVQLLQKRKVFFAKFFGDCLCETRREASPHVNKKKGWCHTRPRPDQILLARPRVPAKH
jgi:uncharacterized C2H2 Zn-finger protein